jgi:hypothetical protein
MGLLRAVVAAVLLLPLFLASRALAAPAAQVDASTKHLELAPYLDVLEDTTAHLGIDDVERPEGAARFTPFRGPTIPNYGFTKSAIWVRFAVTNASDAPLERWLVVDLPSLSRIEVYRDGEPPSVQGVLQPRANRELPRTSYSFRIALQPGQTRVVHLRCHGDGEAQIPMELWEIGALFVHDRAMEAKFAVPYGVMLTMALYNVFLFFFIRDRAHLYYAAAVVFGSGWLLCLDGLLLDLLPDSVQTIPHAINVITAYGNVAFLVFFARRSLHLPALHPRIDRALLTYLGVSCVIPALYLAGVGDFRILNLVGVPFGLVAQLSLLALALLRLLEGQTSARWFAIGWATLLFFFAVVLLSVRGTIPIKATLLPIHIGFALEAVFLSLALAEGVRQRNEEVTQLNVDLRHQVAARSRELTEALARSEGTVSPAALEVGEVFDGRYRVARLLGRGGMGAVYEVERTRDGRKLALKVVTAALSTKHAARFAREAEIGARLHHENLVSILDVGIAEGLTPFLVMELVQGGSMEDKRARFGDVRWALPLLKQIAGGLTELHENQVVHRDLKPANVLLVEHGASGRPIARISDFGISRFGEIDDSGLTETGALMGTPVYMPPEAWHGPARHPSADIFSFGVLAYEALTGRSPFAKPPVTYVRAGQPLPEPAGLDGVPHSQGKLVLACLLADPSGRPTARELTEGL